MALTSTEEALVRQLLEQQVSILSLAGNESTITSKLGATKVTLSDLVAASAVADTDLLLTRQGTNDKSVTAKKLAEYIALQVGIPTAVAGGTTDSITADFTPDVALTNGITVIVRAGAANATTTPTFAPDGLTAKTIVKGNNLALAAGDIAGAGHWLELAWDSTLDKWVLQNPATGILGGLSIASAAEARAFTDNTKAISPLRLKEALQGANQSLAASGYQRLPGGLIIQWGKAVGVANGTSIGVTFPLAFPSLCAAAFANSIIASSGETNTKARTWNTLGMTVYNGDGSASDVHWLAIGF